MSMTEGEVIGGEVRVPAPCSSLSSVKDDVVFSWLLQYHVNVATYVKETVTSLRHLCAHQICISACEEMSAM